MNVHVCLALSCLCAGPLSSVLDGESTDKKVVLAALPLKVTIPISANAKVEDITARGWATLSAPASLSVSAGPSDNLSGVDDRGFSPGRSAMHVDDKTVMATTANLKLLAEASNVSGVNANVLQTDWQDKTSDQKTNASASTGAAAATERACVHALHASVLVACMHSGRPTYADIFARTNCLCISVHDACVD